MARVLIIDRDREAMSHHAAFGGALGHVVDIEPDWKDARDIVARQVPDAVIMGRLGDDIFRYDLCRRLRRLVPAERCVIVVLAPSSAQLTRIRCLEEGADSVLDADAHPETLWSKVAALMSSRNGSSARWRLAYNGIEMDLAGHKAAAAGRPLILNNTSFRILRLFLEHPERPLSRRDISTALGKAGQHQERTIDVHIRMLRQAMKPCRVDSMIVTVPNVGYMICDRATRVSGVTTPPSAGCTAGL